MEGKKLSWNEMIFLRVKERHKIFKIKYPRKCWARWMKKGIHPDTLLWNFKAQKLERTPSRDLEAGCLKTSLSNSLLQKDQEITPLKFKKRLFSLYNACLAKSSIQNEGKIKAFLEMEGLNICILWPSSEKFPWGCMPTKWGQKKGIQERESRETNKQCT